MITLLNTGVATLGVVDLPPTTLNFKIRECFLVCDVPGPDIAVRGAIHWHIGKEIPLPPGNWIILGWSDNLIQEKLWEIGILDYEAWALFLASNGITERKFLIKQVK